MDNHTTYHNPIIPGFAPDPSIVLVDGIFYLVTSSFHVFPGLPIYASRDLQNWTHVGNALNRPEQMSLRRSSTNHVPLDTGFSMVASGGLFAATIRYWRGKFYIICTNAAIDIEDISSSSLDNFIISTTDIWTGDWSDPVYIPFMGIDPSLYFDDDGRAYVQGCYMLQHGKQPTCTIKQFEVDVETGEALSETREIWGGYAKYDTEGPHIYKRGKWYYLLAAEGGTFEHHMLSISRSENVWGPYETAPCNPILTADGTDEYIQNTGHGELFQDSHGLWWAVLLAVRNEPTCQPLGRETFLAPVDWPEDGWPKVQQPKMKFRAPVVDAGSEATMAWPAPIPARLADLYISEPELRRYKLPSSEQGPFSLVPSLENMADRYGTSTFIGRRQRSLESTATTSIDLAHSKCKLMGGSIRAGLAVYKDHMRHAFLEYDFTTRTASCKIRNKSTQLDRVSEASMMIEETAGMLHMMIVASSETYRFLAKVKDGENEWMELGSCGTKELATREMTGPIFGCFATTTAPQGERGEVAFEALVVSTGEKEKEITPRI
ncbi:glycoside hydrolase family 43 protein [Aaosphaeria arxii CBS 175.79]|uniref:Glycoside hydrolase family 43 protein n=1 Tax=Aaosphaeria arxii CBS 175.79 TaxID=1450172 RepID=A0A6A5XXG7_9PLEO|nr:glycoside hydrolase family 43 protein [Aaosphaeria arxii CBS 175.79]KAF2017998.1 glycoside hydrolase family 43 protein [Aaosphaeria arxii CBS 175.79]